MTFWNVLCSHSPPTVNVGRVACDLAPPLGGQVIRPGNGGPEGPPYRNINFFHINDVGRVACDLAPPLGGQVIKPGNGGPEGPPYRKAGFFLVKTSSPSAPALIITASPVASAKLT